MPTGWGVAYRKSISDRERPPVLGRANCGWCQYTRLDREDQRPVTDCTSTLALVGVARYGEAHRQCQEAREEARLRLEQSLLEAFSDDARGSLKAVMTRGASLSSPHRPLGDDSRTVPPGPRTLAHPQIPHLTSRRLHRRLGDYDRTPTLLGGCT